jgi:flagellar protein FliO/FliZ
LTFAIILLLALAGGDLSAQAASNPEQLITIGDEPAAGPAAAQGQPLVSTWDFVRMVLILAAVVGVIYLFFYLLRRSLAPARSEDNLIRVLGQRSLAGSRMLYLVEVGASIYLVGASDSQVSLVAEIADKESLDAVRLAAAQNPIAPQPRRSFAGLLGGLFPGATAGGARGATPHESLSFLKRQKDRLKRM